MAKSKLQTSNDDGFEKYVIFGDVDPKKARRLHELVIEYKRCFLQDEGLQDFLTDNIYEEDKRPKTWLDIPGACFNRRKVILHLAYLEMIINAATIPRLEILRQPSIIVPGQDTGIKIETPEGWDSEKIEWLQERWMTEPKTTEVARNYQKILNKALNEYNSQLVLSMMLQSLHHHYFTQKDIEYHETIEHVMDRDSHHFLDSAYYTTGNRFFHSAGHPWQELSASELGRFFVLTEEEALDGLKRGLK